MKKTITAICALAALAAAADPAADAVMFRKKTQLRPLHSFIEDVAPVKEVKAEEPKPVEAEKPVEAVKPVEETKPQTEEAKPVEAEKAAESAQPQESQPQAVEPQPQVAEPQEAHPVVNVEKKAENVEEKKDEPAGDAAKVGAKKDKKDKPPARDAIITADRTDYDRKEGVVLFDRNVYVDDAQYQMHADRLFLFLDGTNDLKRLVAIGHVAITNEDKRAYCARATFSKKLGRVVMYSDDEITAQLHEEGKKGSDVKGEKITFWLDSEQVEVENPVITMPGGLGGQGDMKKLIGK